MSYVKNAVILSAEPHTGADGTTWKTLVISGDGASFKPGQFLMAAGPKKKGIEWPSPLTIQRSLPRGYEVTVHPNGPLYDLRVGDAVVIWGPNGKEPPLEGQFSVLCDAQGLIFAAPVIREWENRCSGVFVSGTYSADAAARFLNGLEVNPAEALKGPADNDGGQLLVALPLAELARRMRETPAIFEKSTAFIGAKIGCGIGACRGCFIHSGPKSTGTAVCQEGPFMQTADIDYTRDQNFLGHYI